MIITSCKLNLKISTDKTIKIKNFQINLQAEYGCGISLTGKLAASPTIKSLQKRNTTKSKILNWKPKKGTVGKQIDNRKTSSQMWWIQNVPVLWWYGRIGKVFELAEPRFNCDMECDYHIRAIFLYRDCNRILNPCDAVKNINVFFWSFLFFPLFFEGGRIKAMLFY